MWRSILFLLPFIPHFVLAQSVPATYTIYGTVQSPDGSPASGIIVRISSQASYNLQAITNDLGRYEISGLPRGRYNVTAVNPSDPEQFTDSVEVDATRGISNRILINFFLRSGAKIESRRGREAISVTVAEASQRVPKLAQKALEEAEKYRTKKQYEKALASYSRSIELFPAYFQALAGRGHLRIAMGQVSEAAQDFAHALELDDSYEPALRGSGICKFQERRFEEAVEDFVRAVSKAPGNAMNHLFLGISYSALGRPAAARASLEKALTLDPVGAARAHVHLANLWIKEGRPREAIAELQAYLAALPNAPDAEKWQAAVNQLRNKVLKE